jgi:hypothetical protein
MIKSPSMPPNAPLRTLEEKLDRILHHRPLKDSQACSERIDDSTVPQHKPDNAVRYQQTNTAVTTKHLQKRLNQCRQYQDAGQWERAAACLERLIDRNIQMPEVYRQLVNCYASVGEHEKAKQCIGEYSKLFPRDAATDSSAGDTLSPLRTETPTGAGLYQKCALTKELLKKTLQSVCYYPHPTYHMGKLILVPEIFETEDRETNIIVSPRTRIDLTGNVTLGPWCMIGEGTQILTHDHYHQGRRPLLQLQEECGIHWKNKTIGSDVWLHDCIVLSQVTEIPEGVVVGAKSVLTQIPGPYEIWAGNPARKIGER